MDTKEEVNFTAQSRQIIAEIAGTIAAAIPADIFSNPDRLVKTAVDIATRIAIEVGLT